MPFSSVGASLGNEPGIPGGERRHQAAHHLDAWLTQLFLAAVDQHSATVSDFALVAVGSYGRMEQSGRSDLDLVLLHKTGSGSSTDLATSLWYPIWDSGVSLDHSVRTPAQARKLAAQDLKVLTGLLDVRLIAGNDELSEQLRSDVHSDWRKASRKLLPELRELVAERRSRSGDLFQLLEPDIKESYGGLRDVGVLRALNATWLVDTSAHEWKGEYEFLLDVRDQLHQRSSSNRLRLQDHADIAVDLGFETGEKLLRAVYLASRSIAFANEQAWAQTERSRSRKDVRHPLDEGIVSSQGEVVLARSLQDRSLAHAETRSQIPSVWELAAAAGTHELPINSSLLNRYQSLDAQQWSASARESFIRLLGSRYGMLTVWESLDQHGIISPWFPEWEHVRSLPQFNPLHEFTVDRHLLECVVQAQQLTRRVTRPDLLLIAAFLHDIGKGREQDHSVLGAEMARSILTRMGFQDHDIHVVELLVRHHLLLADIATKRDTDDPAILTELANTLETRENMDLLLALTIADSRATGPSLRSSWREKLLTDTASRTSALYPGGVPWDREARWQIPLLELGSDSLAFLVQPELDGYRVIIGADDRVGLLARVAGVFALHRLHVRSADILDRDTMAVQVWNVKPLFGELPDQDIVKRDIHRAMSGELDIEARIGKSPEPDNTASTIALRVSDSQAVVEVRARDRRALLYDIAWAISQCHMTITGARISTLGLDAIDVFFIRDAQGNIPSDAELAVVAAAVQDRLTAH